MKIDIYTSTKDGEKYLSVRAGTKLESMDFTEPLDPDMMSLSPFRTRLEIDASKPHKALNAKDILKQIESKGFALHGAKTQIKLPAKRKRNAATKPKTVKKTARKLTAKAKETSSMAVKKPQ